MDTKIESKLGTANQALEQIKIILLYSYADSLLSLSEDQQFCSVYLASLSFKDSSVLSFPAYTKIENKMHNRKTSPS